MTSTRPMPIFDGHNDALLRLWKRGGPDAPRAFLDGESKGQLDLPKARQGGFAGGLFAMFVPSPKKADAPKDAPAFDASANAPMPAPPGLTDAQAATSAMASILVRIEREAEGKVRVCRTIEDIRHCIDTGALAAVLHIEGAEAIDPGFVALDVLHQMGLRSLGPVWSRSNIF